MGRFIFVIAFIALLFFSYIINQRSNAIKVYNACITAHFETNGESEQRCGDLQVKYGYEFLCTYNYSSCFVERNTDLQ